MVPTSYGAQLAGRVFNPTVRDERMHVLDLVMAFQSFSSSSPITNFKKIWQHAKIVKIPKFCSHRIPPSAVIVVTINTHICRGVENGPRLNLSAITDVMSKT